MSFFDMIDDYKLFKKNQIKNGEGGKVKVNLIFKIKI